MLDLVEKETSIEAMKGAYRAAHDAGIDVCSFVLVGLPGETELDILETEKLLNEVRSDSIDVCVYVPYPGTKLYALAKESGFQEPTDLRGWAELGSVGFSAFEEKGILQGLTGAYSAHDRKDDKEGETPQICSRAKEGTAQCASQRMAVRS